MYLAYCDESGDTGLPKATGSYTKAYTISVILIRDTQWLTTLNQVIDFRKFLNKNFGIQQGIELKASYLIHGNGPLKTLGLSESSRMKIYKMGLSLQRKLGILTWAVVMDKGKWENKNYKKPLLDATWENMIERIERFTNDKKETCMVFPDEGNEKYVTGIFRRMRRFGRPNSKYSPSTSLNRNAELIIEDPIFKKSEASYFIQLADLNSYAAYRHVFPESWFGKEYWDLLGTSRVEDVNKLSGGPVGIVLRPQ